MTATPNSFDYWNRGELDPEVTGKVASTAGFDYWNRGELFPTALPVPSTITATGNAALGGLTATATATPTVVGTGSADLGQLTATAAALVTVTATGVAPLGGLAATAVGTVTAQTTTAGGNLVKPRLHLGNSPGRKQKSGTATLRYRLTLAGTGSVDTDASLSLPNANGTGTVLDGSHLRFVYRAEPEPAVHAAGRLRSVLTGTGYATEDPDDDLLVLLTL